MLEEILVPIAGCLMIFGIVMANVWGSVQSRREMNETLRRSIDAGQTLNPELVAMLHKPVRRPEQDLRSGVVLAVLGLGLAGAGILLEIEEGEGFELWIAAMIVGAIGVGQIAAWAIRRDRKA